MRVHSSSILHKPVLLIIGAGMAGTRFALLMAEQHPLYRIVLINQEPHPGYNRIQLSPLLAGEKSFAEIALHSSATYAKHDITLRTGCEVIAIDRRLKTVTLDTGETLSYHKLVLATGSTPTILPLQNHDARGVLTFRSKADVDALLVYAQKPNCRCVVIGGGLLGLEAANALAGHGTKVTVVHSSGHILNRQLDATAAELLQSEFQRRGIDFLLNARSEAVMVDATHRVRGLRCYDGREIAADCLVMTVGIRPNIVLAQAAGLACEQGILVDDFMTTNDADIYAIGECVQFDNHLFGLVAPVYEHAQTLAATLAGNPQPFAVKSEATRLKVSGIDLFSAGVVDAEMPAQTLSYHDPARGVYQKLIVENDTLTGAVLYGDVSDGAWFYQLIREQTPVAAFRDSLLFGQAFCEETAL